MTRRRPAAITLTAVGPLVTVQDLGRPGWLRSGVGPAGAADRGSLKLANRLVGNPEGYAGLEILLGGVELHADQPITVALTGAPAPTTVDGIRIGLASVIELREGSVLRMGLASSGLRSYLAVRGGIDCPAVLGSRSSDTLSGLGPAPVRAGSLLRVGPPPTTVPIVECAPVAPLPDIVLARVVLGPRAEWFDSPKDLLVGTWAITSDTDRIGARLQRVTGPALVRSNTQELPPEPMALGAIQVPPTGSPVVFLADHPITGGYPVIAVVADADVDALAQARPGQRVRFRRQLPTG